MAAKGAPIMVAFSPNVDVSSVELSVEVIKSMLGPHWVDTGSVYAVL